MRSQIQVMVLLLTGLAGWSGLLAGDAHQGTHLKWRDDFISEKTPQGVRDVDLVRITLDGKPIGVLDPRHLPISEDDLIDGCPDGDLDCYPPGVTDGPMVHAISPDEKRLLFSVQMVPDRFNRYLLYFDVASRKIVPLGKIGWEEDDLKDFTFGPDSDFAYFRAGYLLVAVNFKTGRAQEIPPVKDALGPARLPPDLVETNQIHWIRPNLLAFRISRSICQNPDVDLNNETPIFKDLPDMVCTYNFDSRRIVIRSVKTGNVNRSKLVASGKSGKGH